MIRMKLGGDYYDDLAWELDDEHVTHCVDSIRQSLMYVLSFSPSCPVDTGIRCFRCSADTSINVWQWSDNLNALVGHSTQAHQCRNFEKIQQWAKEHGVIGDSLHSHVKPPEDDIPWPVDIHADGSRG